MNKYNCLLTGTVKPENLKHIKTLLLNKSLAFYINVLSSDKIRLSFYCDDTAICELIYIEFTNIASVKFTVIKNVKNKDGLI